MMLVSCPTFAKDVFYDDVTVSEITSIYDGDTFRANIQSFPSIVGDNIGIRVSGIDTPEIRGKCPKEKELAQKAKQFTVEKLRGADTIVWRRPEARAER